MISSDGCRQLVAGSYDVLINEQPSSCVAVLKSFLKHFKHHENELGRPDCGYAKEFRNLKEFSKTLKENKANLLDGETDFNQKKNRYKDIIPFSHTRVILNGNLELEPGSDYINANYIRGPSGSPRAYIACQGPLTCTLVDFWRMIWECDVSVIIMACNEFESGKPKCELYWPEESETSSTYGNIQVTLKRVRQINSDFLIRKFSVKLLEPIATSVQQQQQQVIINAHQNVQESRDFPNINEFRHASNHLHHNHYQSNCTACSPMQPSDNNNQTNIDKHVDISGNSVGNSSASENESITTDTDSQQTHNHHQPNEHHHNQHQHQQQQQAKSTGYNRTVLMERTICQFHYTTWPDHGVPPSVQPILELVRLVREVQPAEDRPILVHCSAGCGRTGTICCIDYVWGLLRLNKLDSNFDLYTIISEMRKQRMAMVQTLEQYILCHRAIAALFAQQLQLIDNDDGEEDEDAERNFKDNDDGDDDDIDDEQDFGPIFI